MVEELKAGGGIDVEKGESGRQLECEAATRQEQDPWAWTREAESGPATTWPLGELLMARHDLQHSRIFNS
jgi:urease accessory protein UreF